MANGFADSVQLARAPALRADHLAHSIEDQRSQQRTLLWRARRVLNRSAPAMLNTWIITLLAAWLVTRI